MGPVADRALEEQVGVTPTAPNVEKNKLQKVIRHIATQELAFIIQAVTNGAD